jgi:uncharacterized membrane protein HdeD (DUF308 family)
MNFLREEKTERIVDAIFLIIIGVLIAVFTNFAAGVFAMTSGILCLVFGALYLFAYFWSFLVHDPWLLLRGIFLLIMGSWILAYPGDFLYTMIFVVSFYLIYFGVQELAYASDLAHLSVKNWWVDLVNGILMIGLAIAILVLQLTGGNSVQLISILAGSSLALEGIMELVLIFGLHRDFKKFHKRVVSEQ